MKNKPIGDGVPLFSGVHPQKTPLWKRILTWFKRPRFTESNLEGSDYLFGYAGEDIKAGDAVSVDHKTGLIKRATGNYGK